MTAEDVADLRRLLDARGRALDLAERRLADARADARSLAQQNERLNETLREARDGLLGLREQLDGLAQPPQAWATIVGPTADGLVDVSVGGRLLRVRIGPELDAAGLRPGGTALLNEAMVLVGRLEGTLLTEVLTFKETLPDGRLLVATPGGDEAVLSAAAELGDLRPGTALLADRRAGIAVSVVPRSDVAELLLEEVPDVSYADIGGLEAQLEQLRDAVELPFLHRDLFARFGLSAPKGVLLYGPPGCGKTMVAKAVAQSLAELMGGDSGSHFLNIKGPELLNKYVGETERQIRLIFARAREYAADGRPVVVFFDEMDSLFRTRGSGVSSDVESTVVPQLLSEIDGVEGLVNVIIIGATNREDLIDPAILRPGRLDAKIKLDRPNRAAAREILGKYLPADTPLNVDEGTPGEYRRRAIDAAVETLYATSEENRFIEVTYASGDKQVMYVSDFVSGAMLANVVSRAKTLAIKEHLTGGPFGVRIAHVVAACRAEVAENEDLPNTTNPDDWARISGKKGERIVYLRTLQSSRELRATDD